MTDRKMLIPDAGHPIGIHKNAHRVVVTSGSLRIAESEATLTLAESTYPPVQYIPRHDVDMSLLERSQHTTYCPYKGVANYYNIPHLGDAARNSVWTYETPFDAVSEIAGHLAFYTDRVSVEIADSMLPSRPH